MNTEYSNTTLLSVHKIWDHAPHNAFTGLTRFKDQWYCTFREGSGHINPPDGQVRILSSTDGKSWSSQPLIECPPRYADLRDPKLVVTPTGQLMLTTAALRPDIQTFVSFSDDGTHWSELEAIGPKNVWLWRVTWHEGVAYSLAGIGGAEDGSRLHQLQLFVSKDGRDFVPRGPGQLPGEPTDESGVAFTDDGLCVCLQRCDAQTGLKARVGVSSAPYEQWTWTGLGYTIGGPDLIRLPDGRFVGAGRLYDRGEPEPGAANDGYVIRTSLGWVDPDEGTFKEFFMLPSFGWDTGYPGLVWHDGILWVVYQSKEIGDVYSDISAIYMARLAFSDGKKP